MLQFVSKHIQLLCSSLFQRYNLYLASWCIITTTIQALFLFQICQQSISIFYYQIRQMSTHSNNLTTGNSYPHSKCLNEIQLSDNKRQNCAKNSQYQTPNIQSTQNDTLDKTKMKIQKLQKQNHQLKLYSSQNLNKFKQQLLKLEQQLIKKQLKLKCQHQHLQADLKAKANLVSKMTQQIDYLTHQNADLRQKRDEIAKLIPQTIMNFFNKQNSNILLSQKSIKKWFKLIQQNLIQKFQIDLAEKLNQEDKKNASQQLKKNNQKQKQKQNQKYTQNQKQKQKYKQNQPRLTFATSYNVESVSKNQIHSIEQINRPNQNNHWKSFFNSQISVAESKDQQQNNSNEYEDVQSSFALTQSKKSLLGRKNQLNFQKTIHFKFQNFRQRQITQNIKQKTQSKQRKQINKVSSIKELIHEQNKPNLSYVGNKSYQNLVNSQTKQKFQSPIYNCEEDQNKKTQKKKIIKKLQKVPQNQNNDMQDLPNCNYYVDNNQVWQKKEAEYEFKNQMLKEYNKVLEDTNYKYKKTNSKYVFSKFNEELTAKKLKFY